MINTVQRFTDLKSEGTLEDHLIGPPACYSLRTSTPSPPLPERVVIESKKRGQPRRFFAMCSSLTLGSLDFQSPLA